MTIGDSAWNVHRLSRCGASDGEDDLKRVLQELDEHKATRQTLEAEHQIFHDFVPNGIYRQYIEDINQILFYIYI